MDTQTVGQNNHNNHRPHRGNYNPRPQLDREFDVDFVHGPITARVTVLRFEVPEYSVVVGMPRADGSIKPFVPYKAKTSGNATGPTISPSRSSSSSGAASPWRPTRRTGTS